MAQPQTDNDEQVRGLWYYLTHPLTALSGFGALAMSLTDPGMLMTIWTATWASIGQVFPLLTIATGYIAPMLPPSTPTEWVLFLGGVAMFAKSLDTVLKAYDRRL